MKILVFAHRLEVGGTQVNAIELTGALRDLCGHDVVLFATPGPMLALAQRAGLRHIPAPNATVHPSLRRMHALRDAVRREQPDVIHAWDWPQCLDAFYGTHLIQRVPLAVTDMSMALSRYLPKRVPTTFGTPELADLARRQGRRPVEVLLPPVDMRHNAPGAVDGAAFRDRLGLRPDEFVLMTVSRLTTWMKAESLRRTLQVVAQLGRTLPLRFVVVGDGDARPDLERAASQVNAGLGRAVVVLTGALVDPRPAYAAADLVIGMGGSALRAMAFAKAVIVVGERGYSDLFGPSTASMFHYKGLYGLGDGDPENSKLLANVRDAVMQPQKLKILGDYSRDFVLDHFSLDVVTRRLSAFLAATVDGGSPLQAAAADGLRTGAILLGRQFMPDWLRRRLPVA